MYLLCSRGRSLIQQSITTVTCQILNKKRHVMAEIHEQNKLTKHLTITIKIKLWIICPNYYQIYLINIAVIITSGWELTGSTLATTVQYCTDQATHVAEISNAYQCCRRLRTRNSYRRLATHLKPDDYYVSCIHIRNVMLCKRPLFTHILTYSHSNSKFLGKPNQLPGQFSSQFLLKQTPGGKLYRIFPC